MTWQVGLNGSGAVYIPLDPSHCEWGGGPVLQMSGGCGCAVEEYGSLVELEMSEVWKRKVEGDVWSCIRGESVCGPEVRVEVVVDVGRWLLGVHGRLGWELWRKIGYGRWSFSNVAVVRIWSGRVESPVCRVSVWRRIVGEKGFKRVVELHDTDDAVMVAGVLVACKMDDSVDGSG